jgi:hypothetical protein
MHVGPPKTGTTALQGALSRSATELLKHGIYYPATDPPSLEGHPSLAWDLLHMAGEQPLRATKAHLSWDRAITEFEASGADTLLVSSEDFSYLVGDHLRLLRGLIDRYPITLVAGVRDPVRLLPSSWRQAVKWGYGWGGIENLTLDAAIPILADFPQLRIAQFMHELEKWLSPQSVGVFTIVEGMPSEQMVRRFGQACNFGDDAISAIISAGVSDRNASLGDWKVATLLALNQFLQNFETTGAPSSDEFRLNLREFLVKQLDSYPDRSAFRIGVTRHSAGILVALREEAQHWVARRPHVGSLEDLDSGLPELVDNAGAGAGATAHDVVLLTWQVLTSAWHEFLQASDYLQAVKEGREWWRSQAERSAAELRTTLDYLKAVEAARDYWHLRAEAKAEQTANEESSGSSRGGA